MKIQKADAPKYKAYKYLISFYQKIKTGFNQKIYFIQFVLAKNQSSLPGSHYNIVADEVAKP